MFSFYEISFDLVIFLYFLCSFSLGFLVKSFITKSMFPYSQIDKPIIKGNNVLKLIDIQSRKLMPSLNANVPAKITISNPKAIRVISLNGSIFLIILFFTNY